MKQLHNLLTGCFLFVAFHLSAQPFILNETVEKFFSDDFTDPSKNFPITSKDDAKFWGTFGDGFYYMERKIEAPRVVLANNSSLNRNFLIKTRVQLGPAKSNEQSVGIVFLAQAGGKGGFILELNRKKSFRIKDIGSGVYITKEGEDGWIKHTSIEGTQVYNKIEIKSFRGQFDIYINDAYVYSFKNNSYKKGDFGLYIGPNSLAKVDYYNAYNLDVPGAPKEIVVKDLQYTIDSLTRVNDSLRTLAIGAQIGTDNMAAIGAIKVLEEQIGIVRKENKRLTSLLADYEKMEMSDIENISNVQGGEVEKMNVLIAQRDSLTERCKVLEDKVSFLEGHIGDIKKEVEEMKTVVSADNPIQDIKTKVVVQKDSIYDADIGLDKMEQPAEEGLEIVGEVQEEEELEDIPLVPLNEQEIPVKAAQKSEFK